MQRKLDDLLSQNSALLDEVKALNARIAELEARNANPPKTPTNSSLPPSRGQKANTAPSATPPQKPPSKGLPGVARMLCETPDQTRDITAETCTCGQALAIFDKSATISGFVPSVSARESMASGCIQRLNQPRHSRSIPELRIRLTQWGE